MPIKILFLKKENFNLNHTKLFLFPVISNDYTKPSLEQNASSDIAEYLDLSQNGVSGEFAEYLNIGGQKEIAEARSRGINSNTGINESGEMMEGILYVYGIEARQKDLTKRIILLLILISGIFFLKRTIN